MISDFIKANRKHMIKDNSIMYSDIFFKYILDITLLKKKFRKESDLIVFLNSIYGEDFLNHSLLKKQIKSYMGGITLCRFEINEFSKECLKKVLKFRENNKLFLLSNEELFNKIYSIINKTDCCFNVCYQHILVLLGKELNLDKLEIESLYYSFLNDRSGSITKIETLLSGVNNYYLLLPIDEIIDLDKIQSNLLIYLNIYIVNDLIEANPSILLMVFLHTAEVFENSIKGISCGFSELIDSKLDSLSNREFNILVKRYIGVPMGEFSTLQEMGIEYDLTRERVRQIEVNAIKKTKEIATSIKTYLSCTFLKFSENRLFFYDNVLNNELIDDYRFNLVKLCYLFGEQRYKLDIRLFVFYDSERTSKNDILNELKSQLGDYLAIKYFENCCYSEKVFISKNYNMKEKYGLFLSKGTNVADFFLSFVSDIFPRGYHIGSLSDYNKFCDYIEERFDDISEIPSQRSLQSYIERRNFCQIDKGLYIDRNQSIVISEELVEKIIRFISGNKICYYTAVYDHFVQELNDFGVNNHYYLKGIIDSYLPEGMTSYRDYISIGTDYSNTYDLIKNIIQEENACFTLEQLKGIIPGMKDYTLYNALYIEIENGLIWISSKKFIYFQNLDINNSIVDRLRKYTDKLFLDLNTRVLSVNKIYSKMSINEKELFDGLNLKGSFMLFSLMKYLFKDLYFSRPLISIDNNLEGGNDQLIKNYIRKLDRFDSKTINRYIMKMNIRELYSYLEFMEEMSDEYVQIDLDVMVKKELLGWDLEISKKFKNVIDLILNSSKEKSINTISFNGYPLLPKMNYMWNKYLFIGIVRSFLSDGYTIENTSNMYNLTDFIIRRI